MSSMTVNEAMSLLTRGGYHPYRIVPGYAERLGVGTMIVWYRSLYLQLPVPVLPVPVRVWPHLAEPRYESVPSIPHTMERLQQHFGGRVEQMSYSEGVAAISNSLVVTELRRDAPPPETGEVVIWCERMLTADVVHLPVPL